MKYLLAIVVLIAISATGEALECYECGNPPTAKCADPFDTKGELKPKNFTTSCICMKAIVKTSNATITQRGCVQPAVGRATDFMIKDMEVYFCSENQCNGVSTYTAGLSMLMGLATLLIFSNSN